jgi:hypothetical protein
MNLIVLQVSGRTDDLDSLPLAAGINITPSRNVAYSLLMYWQRPSSLTKLGEFHHPMPLLIAQVSEIIIKRHRQMSQHILYDDPGQGQHAMLSTTSLAWSRPVFPILCPG